MIEINKVVYEIDIGKVAYKIARCENRMCSKFVNQCMESKSEKIELLHASDPRNEMVEINKVVYEIEIDKVVKITCD